MENSNLDNIFLGQFCENFKLYKKAIRENATVMVFTKKNQLFYGKIKLVTEKEISISSFDSTNNVSLAINQIDFIKKIQ
jgi:hypothetical protein